MRNIEGGTGETTMRASNGFRLRPVWRLLLLHLGVEIASRMTHACLDKSWETLVSRNEAFSPWPSVQLGGNLSVWRLKPVLVGWWWRHQSTRGGAVRRKSTTHPHASYNYYPLPVPILSKTLS